MKSFLLLISLLVFFLFQIRIYTQTEEQNEEISELYKTLTTLDEQGEYLNITSILLRILSVNPKDKSAKKILSTVFNKYFEKISTDLQLVSSILNDLDLNDLHFPIPRRVSIYYQLNDEGKIYELLKSLSSLDTNQLHISFDEISALDPTRDNQLYSDILKFYQPYINNSEIVSVLVLYYNQNLEAELNLLLAEFESEYTWTTIIQDSLKMEKINEAFYSLDPFNNPTLYSRIVKSFRHFLDIEYFPKFIISLYNAKQFEMLDSALIDVGQYDSLSSVEYFDDLIRIDPTIDTLYFQKIIRILWNPDFSKRIDTISTEKQLYSLSKTTYLAHLQETTKEIFSKINKKIRAGLVPFQTMAIWGISCIHNNEANNAKKFFDQVYNFGTDSSILFLNRELDWWYEYTHQKQFNFQSNSDLKISEDINDNKVNIQSTIVRDSIVLGNYYALLIGVQNYTDQNMDLEFPLKDINDFYIELTTDYTFESNNVIVLKNPTRSQVFQNFQNLRDQLGPADNLLVFYAGHGLYNDETGQGYWLPSDAGRNDQTNWISNSEIRDNIKGIKCKHTLLISDACFSGGIFKTRSAFIETDDKSLLEKYNNNSRKAITSGALESVQDKSIFIEYLLKNLNQNNVKYLPAEVLYLNLRQVVTNNSGNSQKPLYGTISGTDDKGGDFIFIRR